MRVPGIPYVQGRNSYSDVDSTKYGIAIHNTSNTATAEGEASYATRRTDGVSAHFYVDSDSVVQSLDTAARAGHAGSSQGNNHAVAVEITGLNSWTREQWLQRVAWDRLGRVLAVVCEHYSIEVRRASVAEMQANPRVRAFYSHDDMRRAWGGTTHTDPGPGFPWDRLFEAVTAAGEGDDMDLDQIATLNSVSGRAYALFADRDEATWYDPRKKANIREPNVSRQRRLVLEANVAALAGRDWVDEEQIVTGVLSGLGARPTEQVAQALVAAGQDPAALAAALSALAGQPAQG